MIGSAGSPEKVEHLNDELGFDAAFDYHDGPVHKLLRAAAPDGIDVYFDNVGGDHLEAALALAQTVRPHRRLRLDLDLQRHRAAARPAQLGHLVGQAADAYAASSSSTTSTASARSSTRSAAWVASGELKFRETVVEGGIEAAPQAFIDMLSGANTGKMVVRLT